MRLCLLVLSVVVIGACGGKSKDGSNPDGGGSSISGISLGFDTASQSVPGTAAQIRATVRLSAAVSETLYVQFNMSGTALAGRDYRLSGAGGSLVIPAGMTSADLTVDVVPSFTPGPTVTAVFTLGSVSTSSVTIDPARSTFTLSIGNALKAHVGVHGPTQAEVSEVSGQQLTFDVRSDVAVAAPLNVNFSLSGIATAGVDYTLTTPSPVTIPANGSSAQIVISVLNNTKFQTYRKTLTVTLDSADGSEIDPQSKTATATILDDEMLTVSGEATPATLVQGSGANTIPITISEVQTEEVNVNYYVIPNGLVEGTDYVPGTPAGQVVIPAGETHGTATVTLPTPTKASCGGALSFYFSNPRLASEAPGRPQGNNVVVHYAVANNTVPTPGTNDLTITATFPSHSEMEMLFYYGPDTSNLVWLDQSSGTSLHTSIGGGAADGSYHMFFRVDPNGSPVTTTVVLSQSFCKSDTLTLTVPAQLSASNLLTIDKAGDVYTVH